MKAISLWQPWATLIALGAKQFETRSWSTRLRGRIAIHAAKRRVVMKDLTLPIYSALHAGGIKDVRQMPLGVVICTVELVNVLRTEDALGLGLISDRERAFGDFSPGRYCWKLEDVQLVEHSPAIGVQGFWEWTPYTEEGNNFSE